MHTLTDRLLKQAAGARNGQPGRSGGFSPLPPHKRGGGKGRNIPPRPQQGAAIPPEAQAFYADRNLANALRYIQKNNGNPRAHADPNFHKAWQVVDAAAAKLGGNPAAQQALRREAEMINGVRAPVNPNAAAPMPMPGSGGGRSGPPAPPPTALAVVPGGGPLGQLGPGGVAAGGKGAPFRQEANVTPAAKPGFSTKAKVISGLGATAVGVGGASAIRHGLKDSDSTGAAGAAGTGADGAGGTDKPKPYDYTNVGYGGMGGAGLGLVLSLIKKDPSLADSLLYTLGGGALGAGLGAGFNAMGTLGSSKAASVTPVRNGVLHRWVKEAGKGAHIAAGAAGGAIGGAVRGGIAGLSLGVILNALLKDSAKAETVYELLKRAKPWALGGAGIGAGIGGIGGAAIGHQIGSLNG